MIYITGDTHGQFDHVVEFCYRVKTKTDDVLIILGDAGINFGGGYRDYLGKNLCMHCL